MEIVIHSKFLEPITVVNLPIDQYKDLIKSGKLVCTIDNDKSKLIKIFTHEIKVTEDEIYHIFWTPDEENALIIVPSLLVGQKNLIRQK